MSVSEPFILECTGCGKQYVSDPPDYLCHACSRENRPEAPPEGILKVLYDYHRLRQMPDLYKHLHTTGYIDLLPIRSLKSLPPLRIGNTPLYRFNKLDGKTLAVPFYIKDDSQNPTWSFKDRASGLISAFASENHFTSIVVASTGNAGSSMAGICASSQQKALVLMPKSAPEAKIRQVLMYGAQALLVEGSYDQAYELSIGLSNTFGWYNRNTAYNPLTIEGKKTVSFELFDSLRDLLNGPVFVSVGDGVILSGLYKGFEELYLLGIIARVPKIVAVQAAGSDNLVRNLDQTTFTSKESATLADSISVDVPRNFYMARQFLHIYDGDAITVTDKEISRASEILARNTGLFAEPAAAAAFAGYISYTARDLFRTDDRPVIMITGSGLKDLPATAGIVSLPESVRPDMGSVTERLAKTGFI